MSDQTERITVDFRGESATEGFDKIREAAAKANAELNKTTKAVDNAEKAVDNLLGVGRRTSSTMKQTAVDVEHAGKKIEETGDKAKAAGSKFDSFQKSLFGVKTSAAFIWDMAADGFRMAMGFANAFIERMSAVQRTFSLLATIPNSDAGNEFEYLIRIANNYGLSLRAIQDDYAKMNLAAQNTKLTQEDLRRVFEQVSMATRTLHMNQQQTQLTFLAVEQMMSKGKISMEELRKQFAERVPGAMDALAREMGVTYKQMEDFITKVGASSEKIVPLLGNAVQRLFQGGVMNAAQALDAELNRIQTSIAVFFKNVADAGGSEGMANLLRTINGLLQIDTIAKVFADAMNKITNGIARFLSTLKPDDIEKFAKTALDFLYAFASLTMAAGQAVIFLAQNLPAVGAAIGAFVGATAGAPFGPWGAAIGMIGGGIGGYIGAKSVQGSAMTPDKLASETLRFQELDARVRQMEEEQARVDAIPGVKGWWEGVKHRRGHRTAIEYEELVKKRDALKKELEPMWSASLAAQTPFNLDMPTLADPREMLKGTEAQIAALLKKLFGQDGKGKEKKTPEQRLAERQQNAVEDLLAKVKATLAPEVDGYAVLETNLRQLGINEKHPKFGEVQDAIKKLQEFRNQKAQEVSDAKTLRREEMYTGHMTAANADIAKFKERFDTGNLQQIDDTDVAAKARKMMSDLNGVLLEQKKKWDEMAIKDPLFNFGFDRDERLRELREIGNAYIAEFQRIETEKRSIMGGTRSFLQEWNANATNFGKITHDFLSGVSTNITDMLFNLVRNGEFSFKKLTLFVLEYITKMMIVQSITPMVNSFAGFLSSSIGSLLGVGASATSSMYSLSGGGGGLGLKMRANGGPVWPGEPFVVGERGPEIVTFDRPGYVTPNESIRSGGGGGSGSNISVQVNVDASGNTSVSGDGAAANMGRRISEAVRAVLIDELRPGGVLA